MRKLILSGWVGLMSLTFPLVVKAQTYDWAMKVGGTTADQANSIGTDGSNNIFVGGNFSNGSAAAINFNPLGTASNLNASVNGDAYLAKYNSSGVLQRAFKIGGAQDDKVNYVSVDASNNVYMTGYFKGSANLDPAFTVAGSVAGGSGAIMIAKYNNALDFQWGFALKDASGSTSNAGYGIVADASGNVYVTGSFGGSIDFNPDPGTDPEDTYILNSGSSTNLDIFVAKYNSAGIFQWAFSIGGLTYSDVGYGIALDASNNVYITGKFIGTVDFNPSSTVTNDLIETAGPSSGDGFVAKYNSSGAYQWGINFGAPLADQGRAIAVTSGGTVFITGSFQGVTAPLADFDPVGTAELTSAGLSDMFVASYTTSGTYLWAKRAGGTTDDLGVGIALDASGQPYVTGYVSTASGTVNFGAEAITVAGLKDAFYAKYNSADGTNLFAKGLGGANDDTGGGISIDGSSSIVVVGGFNGTSVDFDPSGTTNALTTNGGSDIFHARYTQCAAPVISTQPVLQNICSGTTATFSVVASGGTLSYQWKRGTTDVGINSATLTIPTAGAGDLGSYTVVVTNTCPASVTSSAVALTFKTATSITTQPTFTGPVCTGSTLTLSVVAAGSGLSYQWKQGSTNVGTNSATFTKTAAVTDNGSYTVVVTGDCGAAVTSSAAAVTISPATSITTQPSFTGPVCSGSTLTLSVVATGTGLDYQWKQGSTNVGTNSATYTKASATTGDNGSYTVVVTGDCGAAVTSSAAAVTISPATAITTQPSFTGPLCTGSTLTLSVVATGSNLSYQWKQGSTNVGTNSATFTKTAAVTDNGSYTVVVTGDCGAAVTSSATTVTISPATAITTQPSFTGPVCTGATLTLSVVASGTNLTYQWKQGSTNVGTNSATFTKTAAVTDNGSYTVVVTGDCGAAVTSSATTVTISPATSITTQPTFTGPVCSGSALNLSVVASGTGLSYQWKQGSTNVGTNSATFTKTAAVTDNGSYTVVVTGTCGAAVTSSATTVTISPVTAITTQPSFTGPVCSGSTLTLSVVATGTGLDYQWKQGSTNVGTNSATYTKASATTGDNGSYTVVVTGDCGAAVTSSAAAVTISPATSITTQPVFTGPVCSGSTLTLSVVASGTGLDYQWKQGSTNVGTNSATFTKTAAVTDNGSYTVVVTGDCGAAVTSTATTVTISTPPSVTTQPTAQNVCSGSPASFTVVASGTAPLSYQWKQGSTNVGTNSATYSIASASAGDVGSYSVVVSNGCTPNATSGTAALSLKTPTSITTQPSFTGTVCQGSALSLSVVAAGSGTLSYQWKQGSTNVGTNSATYTKASSATTDDGSYTVVVTGDCGSVTSSATTVTISTPPTITTQPTNESICAGSPATFTVVASGTAPLSYQWKKGSTNVGTNSATYTIASPVSGDVGSYSVVVSNACTPNVTSNTVSLAIGTTTAITTQPSFTGTLCQGSTLNLNVVAVGSNLTYQWKQGSTNVGTNSATYTKASATTADNGSYTVVVTGDCGAAVTSSATAVTISTPPAIITQPTAENACPGTSATFDVVATGTGLSYQWFKGGSTPVGTNSATYTIPSVVAGDAGNYSVTVTGTCAPTTTTSSSVALTIGGSPVINTQPQSQSVCVGSTTTFTVAASGSGLTYQWKKGGTDIGSATSATYVISNTAVADAGSYTVSVTSTCGSPVLSSPAAVLTVKTLPSITTQPTAQTVCAGSALNVSVLASGSSLTYQWSHNGSPIGGANAATYHVNNASSADIGTYSVLISNGCAPDVTSNTVSVTVNELPAITQQPVNASVCAAGQTATFTVTATGTGLSYQWVKNGVTNVGSNSDTYTIPAVAVGDVGNYAVTVSGTCAPAVTSNTVTLSISTASVTIVTQPTTQTVCIGDDLNLIVAATGPSLSYQWKKGTTSLSDAGNISGSTTSNLTITNVVTGDAGSYSVVITSTCASPATSNAAVITVSSCTGVIAQQGNMFYVSPNPGTDNFYLNATGIADGEATVTVMNALGYEVWRGNAVITGGELQQALPADLSSGVYTVMLSNSNGKYITKLVVQQ